MPKVQSQAPSCHLEISVEEARSLIGVSDVYQRSMGPMRHVVRLTTSRDVRGRFDFLDEESRILRSFAEAMVKEAGERPSGHARIRFTLKALIAYWGRLLSSTQTPRSRRRLSEEEIERREALAAKLTACALSLQARAAAAVEDEIGTRRPSERAWMRERLGLGDGAAASHLQ
jgi:hypothetical protein